MSNNFKAEYDRMRTTKPEYETMRIMLKDGSLIKPELIQRSDLFSGNVELFNARLQYDQDSLEQLRDSIIAIGVQDDLRGFYWSSALVCLCMGKRDGTPCSKATLQARQAR